MLQTVQFDTATDEVISVLDSIAKSYGYADAWTAVGVDNLQQPLERLTTPPPSPRPDYPPNADVPTRARIEWRLAKEAKEARTPRKEKSVTAPWDLANTRNFLMEITPTSRKLFALLVVEGDVTAWQVTEFIGVQTLKGLFSSIGAAKNRTKGLVRARRAYMKRHHQDGFHYVMTNEFRDLFMDAFLSAGLDKLLEEAEQYIATDQAMPVGEAG